MSEIVAFQNVSKTFKRPQGLRSELVHALKDVSFRIESGEFVGVIGHNGAGKSTSIKLMMGFIRADAGRVLVRGREASDSEARRLLGYVPENSSFSDFLTGAEILDALGAMSGLNAAERGERARRLLEALDIAHAAKRLVRTYSKGMVQRLSIAQALIGKPDVLILDEPMTGLDPIGRRQVLDVLSEQLKQGVSLIFCSHLLSDVQQLCERVLWMNRGVLKFDGPVRDLVEDRALFELTYRGTVALPEAIAVGREMFRVHIQPEQLQSMVSAVEGVGGRVESFHPVTRALEDVFISSVEQ